MDFILSSFQGSSKANVHMEWDKIWALNKKVCSYKGPFTEAIFVALKLQLQNRACKPAAIASRF